MENWREEPLVESLEREVGADWTNLRAARELTRARMAELHSAVAPLAPEDTSIVVFGSLARDEFTSGSDIDWTLLVDGLANPNHLDVAFEVGAKLEELGFGPPGREGTFAGLAFSHELVHNIGGSNDTNRNTTQRILLLLESAPIGRREAYDRVIREVLKRYIIEDWGWMHTEVRVPRFLLNDIARYWRTVAVDFAYKRRQRHGNGWALRTVKLRMSRKLTYASGLLACFGLALSEGASAPAAPSDRAIPPVSRLSSVVGRTPLEIVASTALTYRSLLAPARRLIDSYDEFVGLLNDEAARQRLQRLAPGAAETDELYQEARRMSHSFQDALDQIFLEENGTELFALTRKYGVF